MRTTRHRRGAPAAIGALALGPLAVLLAAAAASAAGPPFPPPVEGQAVYDTANVLRDDTERRAEATIDAIEERTGAEIVVYTQRIPGSESDEQAQRNAQALGNAWGVGRRGFDDGLVILFDLEQARPCHGQVQLYAGDGYAAAFLSNGERQAIYENDMVPLLSGCDLDGALLVALDRIDANATPEHAATLERARLLNAILGLLVAPLLFVAVMAWGLWGWLRFGRDPVYLDDPSIHMPAPPPGLTPAAAALVRDGRSNRRALTAAVVDLARRGRIAFRPEPKGFLGIGREKFGIETEVPDPADPVALARLELARRRPMDPATETLDRHLSSIGGAAGFIEPDEIVKLGQHVSQFNRQLEDHAVRNGWFRERPSKATGRWIGRGVLVLVLGFVALFGGFSLPADGLTAVGIALIAAGIGLMILAVPMPARTMPGAMVRAMLEAYRRTLQATMAQARSMDQVVAESAIPLLESPDDVVVWGVALGLQAEVERVLERTAEDLQAGRATGAWLPLWYGGAALAGGGGGDGGRAGLAPGLMAASAIPNFGGMMAALSTIGNSPSSSGSGGGGGGFSGGGFSGGGGAGGGF